jgi:SRSO17 transposase
MLTMDKETQPLPQAPSVLHPDLETFLAPIWKHFARPESRLAVQNYVTGLLLQHPNKNCDTLAEVLPDSSEQQLQGMLTAMQWEADDVNASRIAWMLSQVRQGDGVLIVDDTGFLKQGNASVGVARQYTGTAGKVTNCQVAVTTVYAERTLAWPLFTRLYLPESWAADTQRRAQAHVPSEITFQTKPQLALAAIDQARAASVSFACVVADADYGDNPNFLAGLETRQEHYVVAIRADFRAQIGTTGAPMRVDALLASLPEHRWRTLRWRKGSTGWLVGRFVAVRAWRALPDGTHRLGWLIGERPLEDQTGERAYYWSNFGASMPLKVLVEYAHRRHHIERFHEESKELLGWDQYQGRLWTGFHRHATLIMLSYSFLAWLEWQQRQQQQRKPGRPRGVFSPAARSSQGLTGDDPSSDLSLAPVSRD